MPYPMETILIAAADHEDALLDRLTSLKAQHEKHAQITHSHTASVAASRLAENVGQGIELLKVGKLHAISVDMRLWVPVSEAAEYVMRKHYASL